MKLPPTEGYAGLTHSTQGLVGRPKTAAICRPDGVIQGLPYLVDCTVADVDISNGLADS